MDFAERHYKDVTIHAPDTLCARMKGGITQHPEQKRTQEQSQDEGYDDDPKCKAHFPPWRGLLCLYGFFHGVMGSHTVCRMESSLSSFPRP